MRHLSCAIALAVVACSWDTYDPRLNAVVNEGGSAPGGEGGEAPGGMGGMGGMGTGGGSSTSMCGSVASLGVTFDDPLNAQFWSNYTSSSGAVGIAGGAHTFTVQTSDYSNAELNTVHFHDLRGGSVGVEISNTTITGARAAHFWVGPDSNHHLRWTLTGGRLRAIYEIGNSGVELASAAYDEMAHRWWRVREADGTAFWEVSADGATWTALAERIVTGLFPMDNVRMRMQLYASGTAPMVAETLTLDTVVAEGPGDGGWCPIANISDDLDDSFRARDWLLTGGSDGAGVLEIDGQAVFNLLGGVANDYQYVSSQNYDLTNGGITVELIQHGGAGTESFLDLTRPGQRVTLSVVEIDDNGLLRTVVQALTDVDGDVVAHGNAGYLPNTHRFLRIRHDSTGLIWDTSTDGTTWPAGPSDSGFIANVTVPPGLIIDDLDVRFGTRGTPPTDPVQAIFDNLNVLP